MCVCVCVCQCVCVCVCVCVCAEFKITSGLRPISVHFIKTASRNTACSVSVADQSYRMYCVVFEVVALV